MAATLSALQSPPQVCPDILLQNRQSLRQGSMHILTPLPWPFMVVWTAAGAEVEVSGGPEAQRQDGDSG